MNQVCIKNCQKQDQDRKWSIDRKYSQTCLKIWYLDFTPSLNCSWNCKFFTAKASYASFAPCWSETVRHLSCDCSHQLSLSVWPRNECGDCPNISRVYMCFVLTIGWYVTEKHDLIVYVWFNVYCFLKIHWSDNPLLSFFILLTTTIFWVSNNLRLWLSIIQQNYKKLVVNSKSVKTGTKIKKEFEN